MQRSNSNLIEKVQLNLDDSKDEHSASDINRLACCLKNAIFSKYISNYLIETAKEMWDLYEKRIDQYLQERHLDITCSYHRPLAFFQMTLQLEELARQQQENIIACKRDIEILCSLRKRARNDDKYSVPLQSTQHSTTSGNSIRVPRTPRCIDRYENHIDKFADEFFND